MTLNTEITNNIANNVDNSQSSTTLLTKKPLAKFITFEGTEGVGKTTAINNLCNKLREQGIDYLRTREPGGSEFAEQLREILLNPKTDINDDTELLLMFTARSDHLQKVILPALEKGQWVICDRFYDSSFAYQGYGRSDADEHMLTKINQLIDGFVSKKPDLTLWLDLPVAEGMERAGKRSKADRFEQQQLGFFQRVHQGFSFLAGNEPTRFKRIDASGSAEEVSERVWAVVESLI